MSISNNIKALYNEVPSYVTIVAVSKTKSADMIKEAYEAGHIDFGENKVQELVSKYERLPSGIKWHIVGHLQTNKVKYIIPFIHLIHSVDRMKLLHTINKEALKHNRVIPCLLQIHIAKEETKFGYNYDEVRQVLNSPEYKQYEGVRIDGVMGMATFTQNVETIRSEFASLHSIFEKLRNEFFPNAGHFKEISMGMSNDYKIAIEEGSTMVRIGSAIFGHR